MSSEEDDGIADLQAALEKMRTENRVLLEQEQAAQRQIESLQAQLENERLHTEMDKLRAAEAVRQEKHARSEKWLEDLREGHQREKQALQEKVEALEAKKHSRERYCLRRDRF